jgi:hypothetical protein
MIETQELAWLTQREHERVVRDGRLARIARCARECGTAPANVVARLLRAFMPASPSC